MEWDSKKRKTSASVREIGFVLLAAGVLTLAAGIVLTVTFGTFLALVLLGGSALLNTAAIICLRHGKQHRKGE